MPMIASVPNLRDLGGLRAGEGRAVIAGRLFRSVDLSRLTDDDLPAFEALGLVTVVDFRTAAERTAAPDRVVDGARELQLDVLADMPDAGAARIPELMKDPAAFLAGVQLTDLMTEFESVYRGLVTLPSSVTGYRAFVGELADADAAPLLFHCTTGKDRTGWAAAIALSILGVDRGDILRDYELTNAELLPALAPMITQMVDGGIDESLARTILGVRPEFLAAAFDEVDVRHGSMETYLRDVLGADDATAAQIRAGLLT